MRTRVFAWRNLREILRDPLSLGFSLGFPVVLLLMMSLMRQSIPDMPADVFGLESFTPGMAVFGLSFLGMFLGMLMTGDRKTAFLQRLFISPMRGGEFILGYALPFLPLAVLESAVTFLLAGILGLPLGMGILWAILVMLPVSLLFVALGLLMGSCLGNSQQVGGIGSILINVAALLSGTWFSLELIGGTFQSVCNLVPFAHAVDAVKAALAGDLAAVLPHLIWVLGYALVLTALAVWIFHRRMTGKKG